MPDLQFPQQPPLLPAPDTKQFRPVSTAVPAHLPEIRCRSLLPQYFSSVPHPFLPPLPQKNFPPLPLLVLPKVFPPSVQADFLPWDVLFPPAPSFLSSLSLSDIRVPESSQPKRSPPKSPDTVHTRVPPHPAPGDPASAADIPSAPGSASENSLCVPAFPADNRRKSSPDLHLQKPAPAAERDRPAQAGTAPVLRGDPAAVQTVSAVPPPQSSAVQTHSEATALMSPHSKTVFYHPFSRFCSPKALGLRWSAAYGSDTTPCPALFPPVK